MKEKRIMSAFNRKSSGGKHKGKKDKGSGGSESGVGAGIEEMATTSKSEIAQAPPVVTTTASTGKSSSRKQRPNSGIPVAQPPVPPVPVPIPVPAPTQRKIPDVAITDSSADISDTDSIATVTANGPEFRAPTYVISPILHNGITGAPALTNGQAHRRGVLDPTDEILVNPASIPSTPNLNAGRPPSIHESLPASVASSVAVTPSDLPPSGLGRGFRMTVGEIVQHIEGKSHALLQRGDFCTGEPLTDLQFLVQQSRYNSDPHVKRKLVIKLVQNGCLQIFINVFKSVHAADFLKILNPDENNENYQPSEDSMSIKDNISIKDNVSLKDNISLKDSPRHDLTGAEGDSGSLCDNHSLYGDHADPSKISKAFSSERLRNLPDICKNFRAVITLLWNVSDKSPSLCEECLQKGVVQMILHDLTDHRLSVAELKDHYKLYIVKGYLGILTNIIRFHSDSRDIYRDLGGVKILQQYARSPLLMVKTKVVMLLSYIVNESENDIINSSDKNIGFIVKVLQSTIEAENHFSRKYGYWAVEIIAGLNRLAACESNKEKIVQKGILNLYTKLLTGPSSEEEQLLVAQGLWLLSFHPAVRQAILEESSCLRALDALEQTTQREEIRRIARGALWVLHGKIQTYRPPPTPSSSKDHTQPGGHVLVSYQWSCKGVCLRVRDRLRMAGYKVCMDADNMTYTSLESMADAVTKAEVVLVSLSQKYKDSPACRTELEYARSLGRPIIPLKIQSRYNPDGWLAQVVGSNLTFDFTNEENTDSMMPNLVRELGGRGRYKIQEISEGFKSTSGSSPTPSVLTMMSVSTQSDNIQQYLMRLLNWSQIDVSRWLADNGLTLVQERMQDVNGELLYEIKKMQKEAPEAFYKSLGNDLGLDFVTILKFTRALDRI